MKIITTGQVFLSNYELPRCSKQPGKFLDFSSLGRKFKLKFEIYRYF
jgi:hypothetical protein